MINNQIFQNKKGVWFVILALIVIGLFLNGCGAQAAPEPYRVGILSGVEFFANTIDGFKTEMTKLGYKENENIIYDVQQTQFDPVKYRQVLQKFVADEVDLIFVFPTEAALEAKAATQETDIPVLFANANIEGVDLVKNVRQPGGNITGVRYPGPDLAAKRFEILLELVPKAKRIWIPYLKDYPIVPAQLEVLRSAASSLDITLLEAPVTNAAEIEADLQARAAAEDVGIDAILTLDGPVVGNPETFLVFAKFAAEHNIPIGGHLKLVGGYETIFGVTPDNVDIGRQAAVLADKILKGASPGTIPVVSAESYLQINYRAAQKLGMTIPEGLLNLATKIIR